MVREVVKIDEDLCDGCGICVPGCHEGALQIIDGKARLISDLMCDGLGACIGYCPQGAISIGKREAEEYNETKVMETMVSKGKNTVIAHLKHLKDHNETGFLREAVSFMKSHEGELPFSFTEVVSEVHNYQSGCSGGGCPGSSEQQITRKHVVVNEGLTMAAASITDNSDDAGELRQWPVQLHLINPQSAFYRNADVLIAADCTAYAIGNFHQRFLRGKSLAIACPKLDSNLDTYLDKITAMIDHAMINTITVLIMQVPCCSGLLRIVRQAASAAQRKVPVKAIVVSMEGSILQEQWV